MQKNFKYLERETRITCETEDWEGVERKDSRLLETRTVPLGLGPFFSYPGLIEDFLNDNWGNVADEEGSESEDTDQALEELDDYEEDVGKHWLPSPCFIHRTSMDFPTPKQTFSPTKPFRFPNP